MNLYNSLTIYNNDDELITVLYESDNKETWVLNPFDNSMNVYAGETGNDMYYWVLSKAAEIVFIEKSMFYYIKENIDIHKNNVNEYQALLLLHFYGLEHFKEGLF